MLPKDLPAALTHLGEHELQALVKAVTEEAARRNDRSSVSENMEPTRPPVPTGQKAGKAQSPKIEALPLTQSRINAIRAAFKAGVKPRIIARQFGIGLSAIQLALSDKND